RLVAHHRREEARPVDLVQAWRTESRSGAGRRPHERAARVGGRAGGGAPAQRASRAAGPSAGLLVDRVGDAEVVEEEEGSRGDEESGAGPPHVAIIDGPRPPASLRASWAGPRRPRPRAARAAG